MAAASVDPFQQDGRDLVVVRSTGFTVLADCEHPKQSESEV